MSSKKKVTEIDGNILVTNRIPVSNRVMKLHTYGDFIMYRAACDCSTPECDMTIIIEWDKELNRITLSMSKDLIADSHWYTEHWYQSFWNRCKMLWRLLITGRIEVNEYFLFSDEHHIETFIAMLKEGIEYVKSDRNNKSSK